MSVADDAAYRQHLLKRWDRATFQLATVSSLAAVVVTLIEHQTSQYIGEPLSLRAVASVRLPCLLIPFVGLALWFFLRRTAWVSIPAPLLSVVYAIVMDVGFYLLGTNGSALHVIMVFISLLGAGSMLPLTRRVRPAIYGSLALSHIFIEATWNDGRSADARLLTTAPIVLSCFAAWLTLELFFRAHQRAFVLRREMEAAVKKLESSRFEVGRTAATLAAAAAEFSQSATTLSSRVETSRHESSWMAVASREVAEVAKSTLERSRASEKTAANGATHAQFVEVVLTEFELGVRRIDEAVKTSEASLGELQQRTARIGSFVSTIRALASQIHLLSLSAALEAVRAGERGANFATIGQQIGRLAAQSRKATAEVDEIVESVSTQMESSVEAMAEVRQQAVDFNEEFQRARQTLARVEQVIHALQKAMNENATDANVQATKTAELSAATERLVERVQSNAATTAELAQTTEQLEDLAVRLGSLIPDIAPAAPNEPASAARS